MAAALVNIHRRGLLQRGSITLAAVADEEVGSAGARHLLQTMRPDMAIVGELTSLRLAIAHKGSVRPIVTVTGRSADAAQPEEGVNAVEAAADLLVFLRRYAAGLRERVHPLVGPPTFAVVKIEGGVALNAVPASCTITFDRRMVPGETNDSVLAEFEEALEQFNRERGEGHATLAGLGPSTGGPSETPPDHPFVRAAAQALSAMGQSGQPIGLMFNCDMTHFSAAGIPTVVYGPGEIARMHTVDKASPWTIRGLRWTATPPWPWPPWKRERRDGHLNRCGSPGPRGGGQRRRQRRHRYPASGRGGRPGRPAGRVPRAVSRRL